MAETKADEGSFVSKLPEGKQRFLAHVVEQALETGQRTPEDFIRHFPPSAIMGGLKNEPALRAQVLVLTTGIKHKIAIKKSAASAGEDLQIALDEGETDADSIVAIFTPDDRVRFLEAKALWGFCVESRFWTASPSKKPEFERAKQNVAFMLERALFDKLVTHRDIVEGITVDELATRLPRAELGRLLEQALKKPQSFTEADLLTTLPPAELVKHIPLSHVWEHVIVPKIAEKHGYAPPDRDAPDRPTIPPKSAIDEDSDGAFGSIPSKFPAFHGAAKAPAPETKPRHQGVDLENEPMESVPPEEDDELDDVEITDDDIRVS